MNILIDLKSLFTVNQATREIFISVAIQFTTFLLLIALSWIVGKASPRLLKQIIKRLSPSAFFKIYIALFDSLEKMLEIVGIVILLYLSLNFIQEYAGLYQFLKFFAELSITISLSILFCGIFRNFLRTYGIMVIRKLGWELDDLLLVLENVGNIIIGFIAAVAFAQSQNINLIGLVAGLGIGGLAFAVAAQKTLEQIFGTLVIYLDRPYTPGEYIRVHLSSQGTLFARVESIGVRSTKLRTPAKNTLVIVPNSIMAGADIENVTRGKKVMVLFYLDFARILEKSEEALSEKVVKDSINSLFGIDPNSTKIAFIPQENSSGVRARVSFFILGSNENSIDFRKRLLLLANDSIAKKLLTHEIEFTIEEPTIYLESPVTI
ncbi:mechanosensitive ion channel family protein [Nodularia chucula]|uniref:mechanosensitive ion channel family protein n=1 Tax=Nodularia chucula TaxID=3093667 RepID=UPI0039C69B07